MPDKNTVREYLENQGINKMIGRQFKSAQHNDSYIIIGYSTHELLGITINFSLSDKTRGPFGVNLMQCLDDIEVFQE
ncbi:hypothetical protein J4225_03155 [Candidatus Pacearchaeota archaeon]|nr:hypothetical protein [Candidatus Pacearchaeota archaeon]